MSSSQAEPKRWALLIGIDDYAHFKKLSGCVNDVQVMREALVGQFGFPNDHVEVLIDGQATQDAIRRALQGLARRIGKDDVVVVHYSGHGSQMTDREGTQPNGMDETLLPCDSGRAPLPNRDITDDEIYEWLLDVTEITQNVTLIFDCCHSGTMGTREGLLEGFGVETRGVEPDNRPVSELPPSPVNKATRAARVAGMASRDAGQSGWLSLGGKYVLLAGCKHDERSYEYVAPEGGAIHHGALTYFLRQELASVRTGTTYRDLFERVAARVTASYSSQHPQLEGTWDREVFGLRTIEPMVFVGVRQRTGDRVTLEAGASCGLTSGSRWEVYPSGTKKVEDEVKPLGVLEISAVRAVTSDAAVVEETAPGTIQAGTRAVELKHCVNAARLGVKVRADEDPWRSSEYLMDRIDQSPLLRRALPAETADVEVRLLSRENPLAAGEESWLAVARDGSPLSSPRRRSDVDAVDRLLESLENEARTRQVLDLQNGDSALTGWVDFKLLRRLAQDRFEEPERGENGEPVFFEGDQILLEIGNRYHLPLYIYVLNLGVSGAVGMIYPVRGAQQALAPGRTIRPGNLDGDEIDLSVSDEVLQLWRKLKRPSLEGREVMKLFATTHEADFSSLFRPGHRRSGRSNSLDDMVAVTLGGGYRDAQVRNRDREDWTTIDSGYRLRAGARVLTSVS